VRGAAGAAAADCCGWLSTGDWATGAGGLFCTGLGCSGLGSGFFSSGRMTGGGRPSQVLVQTSSGYPLLDEAALSAVRAAQFRPFVEGGFAKPVWVLAPITFNLQ